MAILRKAAQSAFRGGSAGAIAMVLQVVLLMWLRTVINWQYRNGGSIWDAFTALYNEGGIARFYQGAGYALLQGPLSRFGDTAANEGVQELLSGSYPVGVVTLCASLAAALWRIVLTPVDTIKTTLQVTGTSGLDLLKAKVTKHGVWVLYDGALGNWGANMVGHYPWFVVNNQLEQLIPKADNTPRLKLIRRAFIGFCSSVVSDCCSNGIRVVKTFKQTSDIPMTYVEAASSLIESSGIMGLLVRGLGIKVLSNAISSIIFSVIWKMIMDHWGKRNEKTETSTKAE